MAEEGYNRLDCSFAALMAKLNRLSRLSHQGESALPIDAPKDTGSGSSNGSNATDRVEDAVLETASRLLSYQVRRGHICLDMDRLPAPQDWPLYQREQLDREGQREQIEQIGRQQAAAEQDAQDRKIQDRRIYERDLLLAAQNRDCLLNASVVTLQPEREVRPLVWKESRLYLYRYYLYESELLKALEERCRFFADSEQRLEVGSRWLQGLQRTEQSSQQQSSQQGNQQGSQQEGQRGSHRALHHRDYRDHLDRQNLAAIQAFTRPFAIISGGPGRGKTTTVRKILELYSEYRAETRIAVTAPTGKGTARLTESLHAGAPYKLEMPALQIQTIHRLLGKREGVPGYRYDRQNPLPVDLLIIDEASMLDLALLAHILRALPSSAGLALLGDHSQLVSIEAGTVLGDLCRASAGFQRDTVEKLKPLFGEAVVALQNENSTSLSDSIVILKKNYRFSDESGIAALSTAIRRADAQEALKILDKALDEERTPGKENRPDIENRLGEPLPQSLHKRLLEGYLPCLQAKNKSDALQALEKFRVLAPMRSGPSGVEELNRLALDLLGKQKGQVGQEKFSFLYPLLIERNDYNLGLYNGDTGICFQEGDGKKRALFKTAGKEGGELRQFPLPLLPGFEICFAMTIHKSQGSEFDHLLLIIPPEPHPLLTGEMFYTAVTRARKGISLFGSKEVFLDAIGKRIVRHSGMGGLQGSYAEGSD